MAGLPIFGWGIDHYQPKNRPKSMVIKHIKPIYGRTRNDARNPNPLSAELFIFGPYFPPMVLYARAQISSIARRIGATRSANEQRALGSQHFGTKLRKLDTFDMVEMYRHSKTCLRADTIRLKRAGGARRTDIGRRAICGIPSGHQRPICAARSNCEIYRPRKRMDIVD